MNAIAMTNHRPTQKLHPLSLLAQMMSRRVSGCLQVFNSNTSWSIHLEQGKLVYASSTPNAFDRLDQHLRRSSTQIPTLASAVRVQVRLLFSVSAVETVETSRDYEAICWLVEQQHLTADQAAQLIEDLAKEVLESFLALQEGSYDLIQPDPFAGLNQFCQLELRPLVEYCQNQLRQRQTSSRAIAPLPQVAPTQPTIPAAMTVASVVERFSAREVPALPVVPEPVALDPQSSMPSAYESAAEPANRATLRSPEPQQRESYSPTAATPESTRSTYTIACIDDSLTVLNAIKTFLDDRMFTVLMINSPVKALMQIVRSKPDLILLDVEMPNLDGYELCSLLRRHPLFKDTPIIMVTGHTGFVDRAKAKLVRASGYLTKPFTQSDLLKMVFKHLT